MKKSKRNTFLIFVGIVILMIIVGYRMYNKPHQNIQDASAVKATSIVLYNTFSKKEKDSSIYLNKVVEVSGEIKSITKNEQNQQIILLNTNVSGGSVNCTMEEKINSVKPGDNIIVKGICSGYIDGDIDMGLPGDVFLIRCYQSTKIN